MSDSPEWMDAEAHADRALEMFERGRWAEAEAELRKAIALSPDHAEWHFNLGLTLEHAERDADALECYERAIELMPRQPDPLLAAGVVANRLGQFDRAIKWLGRAISMEPSFEEAYAHKIEAHIRSGDHDEAETTFYMAQHALPEPSAQCMAVMAESLMQRQMFERAEWCLRQAMRAEPNLPRLRARLATVFAATGRPQRALQLYLRELREDPGNIATLIEYGSLLHELGRLAEAAEKFRRVLELEPANPEAHFHLGLISLASHRYDQATMEFELVLKLDSQFPGVRGAIGEALLRQGKLPEAKQFLLEEFATMRSSGAGATGRNETCDLMRQSADESAERPELRPSLLPIMSHMAGLLLEAGEPAAAAELLTQAAEIEPNADVLRALALARFQSGDRRGGAAISRRILRLDPQCIRSIHNLALAALQDGRVTVAAGWIRKGMQINAHDDGLRRLRVRVWIALARNGLSQLQRWLRRRAARA